MMDYVWQLLKQLWPAAAERSKVIAAVKFHLVCCDADSARVFRLFEGINQMNLVCLSWPHLISCFSFGSMNTLVHLLLHLTQLHGRLVLGPENHHKGILSNQWHQSWSQDRFQGGDAVLVNLSAPPGEAVWHLSLFIDSFILQLFLLLLLTEFMSLFRAVSIMCINPNVKFSINFSICVWIGWWLDGQMGGWIPFDGQGQVLHLWVLLLDLLDEDHDDILQLWDQPGLSQTEVLVQRRCHLTPGREAESHISSVLWEGFVTYFPFWIETHTSGMISGSEKLLQSKR